MEGVGKASVQGRRTVLWAVPPAWPLTLGRHQGVRLCVIVQVLLAASTSMRAAGKRGLGGRGSRAGGSLPQPGAELMRPSPLSGHTHWKDGGRESPMPPVRSMGGGSSDGLSAQKGAGSGCEPSADTN